MPKQRNVMTLANELYDLYDDLKKEKVSVARGKEMVNAAGKILTASGQQLKYMEMMMSPLFRDSGISLDFMGLQIKRLPNTTDKGKKKRVGGK